MSLRDGTKKMSKSEESDYSRIDLQDTEDEITKKIKKAKTDSSPIPSKVDDLKNRPEALNLINIYSFITNKTIEAANEVDADVSDGDNKETFKMDDVDVNWDDI